MLYSLSALALLAGLATTSDSTELRREKLMDELRKGGYTVMLRHARTDRSFDEQRDPVPTERSKQRNLNDDGIRDAALMGVVFRRYNIRFKEIISSPMYRCVETAEYSVGKPTSTNMLLRVFPTSPEQTALVRKAPTPGTNRLIVTHHFVIELNVPGVKPGYIGESEAAVVRHKSDGTIELIGRITLDDWSALANPGGQSAKPALTREPASHGGGVLAALGRVIHGDDAKAATTPVEVRIPDSHAGHIATEYVKAFNTGIADSMKTFLERWMVDNPDRPVEDRMKTYATLFAEHGALTLTTVHSSEQLEVVLGMKSKRGIFRLTVKSSPEQPMRGSSVTFSILENSHR